MQMLFLNSSCLSESSSDEDKRTKIFSCDELIARLTDEAAAAVAAGGTPSHYGIVGSLQPTSRPKVDKNGRSLDVQFLC